MLRGEPNWGSWSIFKCTEAKNANHNAIVPCYSVVWEEKQDLPSTEMGNVFRIVSKQDLGMRVDV